MSAIVQGPTSASSASDGLTISVAFGSNVTSGNHVLVIVRQAGGVLASTNTLTVADSLGNTYTRAAKTDLALTPDASQLAIFYAPLTTGGACTVTGTTSNSNGRREIQVLEVSGLDTTSGAEAVDNDRGTSTTPNAGNLTTAGAAFLLASFQTVNAYRTGSAGSGWTGISAAAIWGTAYHERRIVTGAGSTYAADFGLSSSDEWIAVGAAFKDATDSTAPTLSGPTSAATGKDAGSGTVTTNEGNGTLYSVVTLTSTPPSAAQVKLGQNASGASLASGLKPTQAITTTGAKTVAYTGLTTGTAYFPYFMHEDAAANQSTVSAGASFTPSTLAYSGTVGAQTGTQGGAFVWSGSNPSTLFSGGIGTKSYTGTGLSGSGLSVNSSTGVLSGTCGTPGSYTVAIVGADQSTAGSEIPQTETSNSFTLTITASGDTTRPTLGGVVTISSVTSSGATATWSAASDNSGTIAGYDYRINGGSFISLGNVLTVTLSGLPASTAHTIDVRARDPSGNVSTPVITGGFTTNSGTPGTFVSGVLKRNNGVLVPSSTITWMTFVVSTTGAFVVTKTGLSTNGAGVFSTTDAALTTGTYSVLWREATGQYGWGVASVA